MMPRPPREVSGLLALMLLHDARREAREDQSGHIVLLEKQDRTRWNHTQIDEALPLVSEALAESPAPYALQAAIAAEHCKAAQAEETNWRAIVRFYDQLQRIDASPVIALNRAVAVAMSEGPRAALDVIDQIAETGELENYHLFHATRADMLRRVGSMDEAAKSYARAIQLASNQRERAYLERRLSEMRTASTTG
jgi:RNA polymerase sigma-70 factor, ECF subfamily